MQAAEQARQALGGGTSGGRHAGPLDAHGMLSVESLMDEIIDRAYDEDHEMAVRFCQAVPCKLHERRMRGKRTDHESLLSQPLDTHREHLSRWRTSEHLHARLCCAA